LVSVTLFVLITWVRPSLRRSHFPLMSLIASGRRYHPSLPRLPKERDRFRSGCLLPPRKVCVESRQNLCLPCGDHRVRSIHRTYIRVLSLDAHCTHLRPSYIGAMSYGMRASPSSFSQSFSILPTSVCPPIIPNADVHPTPFSSVLPSGTGIGSVYTLTLLGDNPVFNKEQERITNSFFACTLAVNAVCTGASFYVPFDDGRDTVLTFHRPALASSGLIAFRIWRTQKQTRDAKMGSNLIQVSVIVIESGVFHIPLLRARQSHK